MTTRSALTAHNLVKTYGTAGVLTTALAGVSLAVNPGESVAVMGPSGSGKTTLLHCLAGVLPPTSGQVLWAGQDLTGLSETARTGLRRTDFGFVFQSGQLLPELPADENAALPLMLAGTSRSQATDIARRWLAYLGLAGMETRRPGELSGGQAQRVAIARALVGSPGVVFADEPTGALDQHTGYEVLQVLTEATRATGAALVIVTHDPQVAAWCSRTVQMRDGRVVADTADGGAAAGQATHPGAPHPGAVTYAPQAAPHPGAVTYAPQAAPSNAPAGAPTHGENTWPGQAAPSPTFPTHTQAVPR
ncbi:ABC transporter ATP-binding protein [Ruania zhangjianzhongii]|uniref:ABC transporter ATP-binding protein n=1 Tax=Ruania zhangjianzhongii TaxID=2603206 RepID=UPI0011C84D81|nr:ABC transporter ATP-binding protein [Ruania zhangjianzhongii]